jgi:hypothetical protein
VDVPEVGFVHGAGCTLTPGRVTHFGPDGQPGTYTLAASVSRLALFGRLMFVARNLAETRICRYSTFDHSEPGLMCRDCHVRAKGEEELHHAPNCQTGHVSKLIAELLTAGSLETHTEAEKEDARRAEACVKFCAQIPTANLEASIPLADMGSSLWMDLRSLFDVKG